MHARQLHSGVPHTRLSHPAACPRQVPCSAYMQPIGLQASTYSPDTWQRPSEGGRGLIQQHRLVRVTVAEAHEAETAEDGPQLDMQMRVRLMMAESSGRLDLTDCRLPALPNQVLELIGLEELSLAGNCLTRLPDGLTRLTNLRKLGLAGNQLSQLPAGIGALQNLEGLWLHGNILTSLPTSMGSLTALKQLSLSGNQLTELPDVWAGMRQLEDLAIAGNMLTEVPPSLGQLPSLRKLSLNGNHLVTLPTDLAGLTALQELWLQGNQLPEVPDAVCDLKGLKELSLADNQISRISSHFTRLRSLEKLWLYGNQLQSLPARFLSGLPGMTQCWLEGNTGLTGHSVTDMLADLASTVSASDQAADSSSWDNSNDRQQTENSSWQLVHPADTASQKRRWKSMTSAASDGNHQSDGAGSAGEGGLKLRSLGLDTSQLKDVDPDVFDRVRRLVKVGVVQGSGPGYFKLAPSQLSTATCQPGQSDIQRQRVLVVAFGSAPGTPNWGGLLGRVYRAASSPAEQVFDVLYVVDPARQWYGACREEAGTPQGGDATSVHVDYYRARLRSHTDHYDHVIMLGDSMGATAALLFAPLATHVLAFCPQVDLTTACMRPGVDLAGLQQLRQHVTAALEELDPAKTKVVVLSGTWQHDLEQINLLPEGKVRHQVFSLDSHRLALYLETQGKLLPLVREAVLGPLGLSPKLARTANLL